MGKCAYAWPTTTWGFLHNAPKRFNPSEQHLWFECNRLIANCIHSIPTPRSSLDKNAQRSKTVKVLSRSYVNESSGASTKARFQKSGSS